jgi:type I restriction enzyme S subunit
MMKPAPAKLRLTPRLRFPEFREAGVWTTEALGSVASISTEKVGDNTCIPMSITSGVGLVSQMEKFGRIIAGSSYTNYLLLKKNDFAYNKSATKEYPEGFIALYSGDELAAVPNSIFTCFRIKGDSPVPQYLNYLFLGNLHGRWLRKFIEVGARAHGSLSINEDDLLALPVPLPCGKKSNAEQQKIASCLSSLDDLIAAERQKLDALKAHKMGLMQHLFPREGETRPRLRFPEFRAGVWEVKKAGFWFANRVTKGEHGLPIYSVTMHDGMVKRDSFDRDFYDIEDAAGNKKACRNDIAYNMMRMWQGALGVAPEDCLVSPAYIVLAPLNDAVPEFFQFMFKLPASLRLLTAHSRGLTKDRLRLYYDDFARIPLPCPAPPEQHRIASCLSSLDDLIAAQGDKLEALKTHKQGLMQQLFPAPEEVGP